jgi:hypothetical protein
MATSSIQVLESRLVVRQILAEQSQPTHSFFGMGRITLLALVMGVAVGCGTASPPTYPVTGQVLFADGSPFKRGGRVEFRCSQVSPVAIARGRIGEDGKFQLETVQVGDGAVAGEHQAIVVPDIPDDTDELTLAQRRQAMRPIDARFQSFDTSGLQFAVTTDASKNHFRIEVWPPGKGPRR